MSLESGFFVSCIVSPFSPNGEPVQELAIGEKSGLSFSLFCVEELFIPLILLLSSDNKLRFSFSFCSIFAFLTVLHLKMETSI